MIEGIQGEGGIMPATVDYLLGLRKLCDEKGLLLLFDAVQCGHFRSGRFQSYQTILEEASASGNAEAAAFMPDAVSMAKSLGAGLPIGGFWVAEKHAGLLSAGMHGTTYGGNAMACAVGHKVIEIVNRDGLEANIRAVGDQFAEGFSKLSAAYPTVIADHRGLGLMRGIVLQPKAQIPGFADQDGSPSGQFVNKLHELGLLTVGSGDQVVRVLPPFNTTHAEAEEALAHIETAAKFAAGL
jgi:acetylornithine/succinyldiaminopimelate/putrescine aminotransferase